jgi:glycopeptide antibiotics resistance protein
MDDSSAVGMFIIYILLYIYFAYTLMIIANKTNTDNSWYAWIPIVNLYLMCKIADKPGWWTILFFIPLVNLVVFIIVGMKMAEKRGKPSWLGILYIFPLLGLVVQGYLAFAD